MSYFLIYTVRTNGVAYLVASSLQCSPSDYQWNRKMKSDKCFNIPTFYKCAKHYHRPGHTSANDHGAEELIAKENRDLRNFPEWEHISHHPFIRQLRSE